MLVIRKTQMDAFATAAVSQFEKDVVIGLKAAHPGRFERVEVLGFVRRASARANAYGFNTTGGVTALLHLMAQFGEELEYAPHRSWAEQILSHPSLPENLKISIVRERLDEVAQGRTVLAFD